MEFKRQFTKDASGQMVCTGVLVRHTGTDAEQKFSRRMVEQAMAEGWMRIEGNMLFVTAQPEDLRYTITREPGHVRWELQAPATAVLVQPATAATEDSGDFVL